MKLVKKGEHSLKRSRAGAGATELSDDTMTALFDLPANGGAEFLALCQKGHDWRRVAVRFENSHHSSVRDWLLSSANHENKVRARIWSAAMPWGKKLSIMGQIHGDGSPAVKPNTKNKISLYCVYCFTVVHVFVVCLL